MTEFKTIKKVLVANRGEIACRIIKSCKENGLKTVAIFSNEDCDAMHVSQSDESYLLSGIGANAYINIEEIVKIAKETETDVVVPGYGFLSENSEFAHALEKAGIFFAGPSVESVETFGLKHSARSLAEKNDVPIVPGTDLIDNVDDAIAAAQKIGYPIMIKSTAGGGGMGLKVVEDEKNLVISLEEVISRGKTLFKNAGVFLEKYIEAGRHIEVQVFGNGKGDVIAFGERECSIQRRHQKVIEEAPSPFIALPSYNNIDLRKKLSTCAVNLASSINYKSAGTVEFLVDDKTGSFYFLEMNTRLQVEHGITELIYNVDLMKLMLLQAEYEARGETGIPLDVLKAEGDYKVTDDGIAIPSGHAIEVRVYAENPIKNFQPSPGILHLVKYADPLIIPDCKLRIDHWVSTGSKISPYFDPLIAKIMVWGPDRQAATNGMIKVLQNTEIYGPTINLHYLEKILLSESYNTGFTLTSFLNDSFVFKPALIEFIKSGSYTTIQDLPGREKYSAGIPLSGPVDPLSLQIANLLLGNDKSTAGIEVSMKGPTIKFHTPAIISLTGAKFKFKVNGKAAPMFAPIEVPANSTVKIGDAIGNGARAYLAIKGGLPDVAEYLGSKSCTPTLNLGGHQGRAIMAGDCLSIVSQDVSELKFGSSLPSKCLPNIEDYDEDSIWTIKCLGGPHDTLDICDKDKIKKFYETVYTVNLNSNRGCTKLDGQSDVFSRVNGKDGGAHPSNILEYSYPTCGISVVGSVMSLFGVDGSTLSGFVCISVPIKSDWWKNGQAKVASKIQFKQVSYDDALKLNQLRADYLNKLEEVITTGGDDYPEYVDELEEYETSDEKLNNTMLYHREKTDQLCELSIRQAGEKMIVIDFGIDEFTLVNNGRQKQLDDNILEYDASSKFSRSIIRTEASSGAISVVFDDSKISRDEILEVIVKLESVIPPPDQLKIKSKLYHLPVCFEHTALKHCIERYTHSQRPYAPYLPSNVDFVMKANNIKLMEEFKANVVGQKQVVTAVSFLCANTLSVNLDPRTRFKTGKYNPARTFTPKGALGSGSVAHSIYSIDSPGGYMIWGMVLPDLTWNTFGRLKASNNRSWFFNNFDQIMYYEVDEAKLTELNNQLLAGKLDIKTEDVEFDFGEYVKFLDSISDEVKELNAAKQASIDKLMEEEETQRNQWLKELEAAKESKTTNTDILNDPSSIKVMGGMAANIFKINYKKGDVITGEDVLIILEAMKMEIPIRAVNEEESDDEEEGVEKAVETKSPKDCKYEVLDIMIEEGDVIGSGDILAVLKAL